MIEDKASEEKLGWFKRIFHHPNFNVVASILTIVGFFLAFFFWYDGIKRPELTYYISSTRTAIIQKGNVTNDLSVTYHGFPVSGDLSSAEIQIWNQGKAPIHGGDILKQIALRTQNGEQIYVANVKASRDVIGFNPTIITSTNFGSGILPLEWKILEQTDALKVQIIYGGNVKTPLIVEGVIEGQPQGIKEYKGTFSIKTVDFYFSLFFPLSMVCQVGFLIAKRKQPSIILMIIFSLVTTGLIIIVMVPHIMDKVPPFGF